MGESKGTGAHGPSLLRTPKAPSALGGDGAGQEESQLLLGPGKALLSPILPQAFTLQISKRPSEALQRTAPVQLPGCGASVCLRALGCQCQLPGNPQPGPCPPSLGEAAPQSCSF